MTELQEGDLIFCFPDGLKATPYDKWSFYCKHFQSAAGGSKAVDFLCLAKGTAWLVEVKDYRFHDRTKETGIVEEVGVKVRDTLAGLAAAAKGAKCVRERQFAKKALSLRQWRVAFHLEQPLTKSSLRPSPFDPAAVLMELRSRVRAIDANPVVCSLNSRHASIPWTARSA